MRSHRTTTARPSLPSDPVVEWRHSRLITAGFPSAVAARLAEDRGIDLHEVLDLTGSGCPPDLAARILAPIGQIRRRF
jgi:hypothetical protein